MKNTIIPFCLILLCSPVFSQWIKLNSGTANSLTDLYFVDGQMGFACGSFGTVVKTLNGGNNWQQLATNTPESFHTIYAVSPDTAFVSRTGLLKTVNGLDFLDTGNLGNFAVRDIHFFDANHGLILGPAGIQETQDGGLTWNTVYSGNLSDRLHAK